MRSITVNEAPVSMARKKSRRFEVRLGLVQTLVLLGFVSGSMACAFYFGYFSGQTMGFDLAMRESLDSAVRLPITDAEIGAEARQEIATEVYAKLSQKGGRSKKQAVQEEIPSLGSIQTTRTAPLDIPEPEPADSGIAREEANPLEREDLVKSNETAQADGQDQLALNRSANEKEALLPGVRILGSANQDSSESSRVSAAGNSPKLGNLLADKAKGLEAEASQVSGSINQKQEALAESLVEKKATVQAEDKQAISSSASNPSQLDSRVSGSEATPEFFEKRASKTVSPVLQEQAREQVALIDDSKISTPPPVTRQVEARPGSVPSGWFAQVAAPDALSDAKQLSAKLRNSGFSAYIEIAQVRGQEYYRVLVGPEGSRKHAERLLSQLERESYLKTRPFIKFVR